MPEGLSRRSMLSLAGLAGVGLALGTAGCARFPSTAAATPSQPADGPRFTRDDLVAAIESADDGRTQLAAGTYVNDGDPIPLPEGHAVSGGAAATIQGAGFVLASRCRLDGLAFVSDGGEGVPAAVAATAPAPSDVAVQACSFTSYHQAVSLPMTADGAGAARWTICNNHFQDCVSGVFQILGSGHVISGNTFLSSLPNSQAIVFYGGSDNRIESNRIEFGITGILLLSNRSITGPRGQFLRNVIAGNTVSRCSEEHISMDCHGDDPKNVASFEQDTVAQAGPGADVVLAAPGWAGAGALYAGYHAMINTGALAGRWAPITAQQDARLTLGLPPEDVAAIRPGDRVIIGAPFVRNEIRDNVVDATERGTTSSIALYGLCYDNTVSGNRCYGRDLWVQSLNSLVRPPRQVTDGAGMAPTEGNRITGNTVGRGATVRLDYTDFGSAPPFVNHGNVVTGNVLQDGAQLALIQQQP